MNKVLVSISSAWVLAMVGACSGSSSPTGSQDGGSNAGVGGGATQTGGSQSSPQGGAHATGGNAATGGAPVGSTGGATQSVSTGGAPSGQGGNPATGGSQAAPGGGNSPTGGKTNTGGSTGVQGGNSPTGGSTGAPGGGGNSPTGGKSGTGTGGSAAGGGGGISATGGKSGTSGGSTSAGGATSSATGGAGGAPTGVTVQLDQTHQTIEGFGLNTALGGGSVPWDALYTTTGSPGLGFSIVRVGLNFDSSSSGSLSGSKPASTYNAKVIGSVWTAPANCKDNNSLTKGGHLLTSCYDSFSTAIANLAKSQGLYAMSAANEPDFASCGTSIGPPCNGDYDTMVYTANEMVAWVKVLGPKLQATGVKLMAPEPSEWLHLWSNASATGSTVASHPNSSDPLGCGCFSNDPTTTGCASKCSQGNGYDYGHYLAADATAWPLVDIVATHEYDTQKALAWPSDVDGGKRSKEVWETEVSGVMYWPEQGFSSESTTASRSQGGSTRRSSLARLPPGSIGGTSRAVATTKAWSARATRR